MNNAKGFVGCLFSTLYIVGHLICIIVTALIIWNWLEPHSFWSFVAFLCLWGAAQSIISGIWQLIVSGIVSIFNQE